MKKTNDAPPTLPVPASKHHNGDRRAGADRREVLTKKKPDFKAIRAKAKKAQPACKLTVGVTNGDKYNFTREPFESPAEVLSAAKKVVEAKHGKGLREIIISFRG